MSGCGSGGYPTLRPRVVRGHAIPRADQRHRSAAPGGAARALIDPARASHALPSAGMTSGSASNISGLAA